MPPTTDAMIWDWPLRVFHWTLVACVAGSWATHHAGIEWFAWHRAFGCASLVLVLFRIAWGWVGTRHARFRSFVRGPRGIVAYLRDPASVPNSGHNPLGALSVLVFLAVLVVVLLAGHAVAALVRAVGLGPADKVLGGLIGMVKGLVILTGFSVAAGRLVTI